MTSVITMANANKNAFIGGDSGGGTSYTAGDGIDIVNEDPTGYPGMHIVNLTWRHLVKLTFC